MSIQDTVGHLHEDALRIKEDCTEQVNLLDHVAVLVDDHTVADIKRMTDEQEDDTGQNVCKGCTNEPAETKNKGPGAGDDSGKACFL